jgi:hypothetical protein
MSSYSSPKLLSLVIDMRMPNYKSLQSIPYYVSSISIAHVAVGVAKVWVMSSSIPNNSEKYH